MSPIVAPARDSTAAHPATPARTIAALPIGTRRVSSDPATAAMTAITASTSTDSTSLSAVPNVWIAHSLTGPGREVDDRRPDRGAGVGRGADEGGQQLGDAERDGGRRDAGHRPAYPAPP